MAQADVKSIEDDRELLLEVGAGDVGVHDAFFSDRDISGLLADYYTYGIGSLTHAESGAVTKMLPYLLWAGM